MRVRRIAVTGALVVCLGFSGLVAMAQMPGMGTPRNPTPPVESFYRGQIVLFIHTEASDPQVAGMLTKMMGPKVLVVPNLAKIPRSLLATVYVFTNGVRGKGPFGFQLDVFDSAPGDAAYTPLRTVSLVVWRPAAKPRVLRSAEEVEAAAAARDVSSTRSGIVVNMPMLTWPGGTR